MRAPPLSPLQQGAPFEIGGPLDLNLCREGAPRVGGSPPTQKETLKETGDKVVLHLPVSSVFTVKKGDRDL